MTLKCPRCDRPVKDNGRTVQGLIFGPLCSDIVYRRQRIRESFGESLKTIRICEVSKKEFYAKTESEDVCPNVTCAVCRYNTRPFLSVALCPLEVKLKQKELSKWN